MRTRAEEQEEARARTEDDDKGPPSSQPEGAPSSRRGEEPGREIPTKCGRDGCGVENDKDAKFCKGCGASMATGEPPADAAAEDPPPSSRPPAPGSSSRAVTSSASFAEILGLPASASVPAQKSALLGWRRVVTKAAAMTGRTDPDEQVGALTAIEKDAANAGRLRAERNKLRERIEVDERMSLAHRLVNAGEPRGRVFVDVVSTDGKRTGIKLTAMYAEMKLGTLRGEVEAREPRREKRDPFKADEAAARAASTDLAKTGGVDKVARIKAAESLPVVRRLYEQGAAQGSKRTLTAVAEAWIDAEDAQRAAVGGVQ